MPWCFASAIDIGDREEQQDRIGLFHSSDHTRHLVVVADGMGGHDQGALAAQTLIDTARSLFESHTDESPARLLENICMQAHERINALRRGQSPAPGSTCILLYLTDSEAHWVHVGDSRLYHLRDDQLMETTSDHSIAQLLQENDTCSPPPQNQLYMCLGGENEVYPEYDFTILSNRETFLLCSDGLWNQIDINDALKRLGQIEATELMAKRLVTQARKAKMGISDNISLITAQWTAPKKIGFRQLLNRLSRQR